MFFQTNMDHSITKVLEMEFIKNVSFAKKNPENLGGEHVNNHVRFNYVWWWQQKLCCASIICPCVILTCVVQLVILVVSCMKCRQYPTQSRLYVLLESQIL